MVSLELRDANGMLNVTTSEVYLDIGSKQLIHSKMKTQIKLKSLMEKPTEQ